MLRADTVLLIAEAPKAHGVLEPAVETTREVFCTVRSITQSEAYQAKGIGLNPEYRLVLSHSFEYEGEKMCVFNGVRYEIIRTYMDEHDGIELTIQRVQGNAEVVTDV